VTAALDLDRRRAARPQALAELEREPSPAAEPSATASHAELARRVEQAVAELPEGQRTIFRLRHEGGYALSEVAEALDLALPTVKTQFARACLKLQHALRPFQDDLRRETTT